MTQITGTRFLPYDLLVQRFGPTRAHAFIDAPVRLRDDEHDRPREEQQGDDDDDELFWGTK